MKLLNEWNFTIVFGSGVLVGFLIAVWVLFPSFQIEHQDGTQNATEQATDDSDVDPPFSIPVTITNQPEPQNEEPNTEQQAREDISLNVEIATVVAAMLAVLLTGGAFWSSHRQAEAAEKVLSTVERGHISTGGFKFNFPPKPGRSMVVRYLIENGGRLTATITSINSVGIVAVELPDQPPPFNFEEVVATVAPGKVQPIRYQRNQIPWSKEEIDALVDESKTFFFIARVLYLDGMNPETRTTAFAVAFDIHEKSFALAGGRAYNYGD